MESELFELFDDIQHFFFVKKLHFINDNFIHSLLDDCVNDAFRR